MFNVSEALEIEKILEYSGFEKSAQQTIIAEDGFERYDDIFALGESDIVNLAKGLSDSTAAVGNIIFGLRRTNLLKSTIHWYQDFRRISWAPSLIGIINAENFRAAIEAAGHITSIRKHIQ